MNKKNKLGNFGRMNDPSASAWIKGICGDEVEFYLYIKNSIIEDVKFYTETGCSDTVLACNEVAKLATSKKVIDALAINPKQVLEKLSFFSSEGSMISDTGRHCAILAVSTLYKAVADYLLQH